MKKIAHILSSLFLALFLGTAFADNDYYVYLENQTGHDFQFQVHSTKCVNDVSYAGSSVMGENGVVIKSGEKLTEPVIIHSKSSGFSCFFTRSADLNWHVNVNVGHYQYIGQYMFQLTSDGNHSADISTINYYKPSYVLNHGATGASIYITISCKKAGSQNC